MRTIFYILIALVSLSSCKLVERWSERTVIQKEQLNVRDSLVYSYRQVLDTLVHEKEVVNGSMSIDQLEQLKEWIIQNGRAKTIIVYKDGKIDVQTVCDSILSVYIKEQIEQSFSKHFQQTQQSTEINQSEEITRKSGGWISGFLYGALAVTILAIALVIYFKFKPNLIALWTRISKRM